MVKKDSSKFVTTLSFTLAQPLELGEMVVEIMDTVNPLSTKPPKSGSSIAVRAFNSGNPSDIISNFETELPQTLVLASQPAIVDDVLLTRSNGDFGEPTEANLEFFVPIEMISNLRMRVKIP